MKTSDIHKVQNGLTLLANLLGEELACAGVGLSDEGIGVAQIELRAFVEGDRNPLLDRVARCDDLTTRVRIQVAATMLREVYECQSDTPPEVALRVCMPLLRVARNFIADMRTDRTMRV